MGLRVIETYRSKTGARVVKARDLRLSKAETALALPHEEEVASLRRQLRRVTERNMVAFDQGFVAATMMVEAGATPERLRAASGVVAVDWADTQPQSLWDEEATQVDLIPLEIQDGR